MTKLTIGIIGGSGCIGRALARALVESGLVDRPHLILSGRSRHPAQPIPDAHYTDDNRALARLSDVVVLSVRPEQFAAVDIDAERRLVISVMAGVAADTIRRRTNATRIVRAMPNAAAEIGQSYTPWFATADVDRTDRSLVHGILSCCGTAEQVAAESDIDYLSGLTGSGPAFVALLADAMITHAVAHGLSHEVSLRAVRGLIDGAGPLVVAGGSTPREIMSALMNYRGTTEAALQAMISHGFVQSVHAGLEAAEATAKTMARAT